MKNITVGDYSYRFAIGENYANGKPTLSIYATYKKNREKYVQGYYYQDMEALIASKEKFVKAKQDRLQSRLEYNEKRKAQRKEKATKLRAEYKVGDLFSYSWGYDQTNIEYFQITEKKGAKVYIKRICGKTTSIDSWASKHSSPVKDSFIEDGYETRDNGWKVIGAYGISMAFGTLSLTNEKAEHFSSSRA